MKIKKTIIVTLFLLCLLMFGTASATDNDAIVGMAIRAAINYKPQAESTTSPIE